MYTVMNIGMAAVLAGALAGAAQAQAASGEAPEQASASVPAQTTAPADETRDASDEQAGPSWGPFEAHTVDLAAFEWVARPIVIFADTPNDPNFGRQLEWLLENTAALEERDIVILTDTDPALASDVRIQLRPRGFSLVLIDKDGEVKQRKPSPWRLREVLAAIDKFPSRRQQMLEQRPGR